MEQIITKAETMDWTMGETGHFSLTLKPGSYVEIDWGDGHKQRITGTGESQQFRHSYGKRLPIRAYTVTIMSEEDNAIMEYCHGFIDMQTLAIDVSGCPGLSRLDAGFTSELDVSGWYRLEALDCRNEIWEMTYYETEKKLEIVKSAILRIVVCVLLDTAPFSGIFCPARSAAERLNAAQASSYRGVMKGAVAQVSLTVNQ